ncbi:MAG: hypothetical protein II309_00890, partial [Bacilli bacterium]|nr:hypothetical protein [Bacilli bacterium]
MKKNIMIIALLFAVLAGSFYLIFMRFQLAFKIDNKSYVFTSNKVIENLYVNGLSGEDVKIDYTVADENEQVYKQGNKYFIGENQKEEISIEYPMLSEDGSRVSNMGNYKILITEDFKISTTFDNAILSEGALYNGTSMDRVDKENYFLFNVQDKVYLNATKITIDLGDETREIPMNSIVYFMEHEIRYYFLYNETFLYSVITGIDDLDTVHFFNSSIGYRDMLLNLEVIVEEEEPEIYIPEEIIPPVRDEEFVIPEDEYVYIKPEATTEVVSTSVYSFKVNLTLNDNARRIETSPTYEIKYNGKTFLRKTLYSTGTFEISGLLPNTEFELVAYFTYRNEHDKLIKKTMLTTTIHTKDISLLEPIKLVYNNDNLYPNKLEFNKMKFMNGKNDEVLKGIKDMEAYINGERYLVSSGNIQKLKKLQEIDYETPPSLKSNTIYDVKFVIYDIAGNELVVENNVTKSKTLKAKPTADISITGTDLTYFDAFIGITNVDNVNIENLIYVITDGDNNIITQGPVGDGNIHVGDLDINSVYNILVYADYDLEDGNGVQKNVLLKQGKVTTKPLSTLGFVRFNLEEKELTQTDAIFDLTINQSSTDAKLLAILDKIYFTIKVKSTDEIVQEVTIEGDDVVNLKATGNSYLLELLGLYSNTYYKIEVTTDVKQGSKVYNIKGLLNLTEFATLKQPATIDIVNQFTNESLIDYDVKVTDLDGAIESNRVILYVRDSSGTLISYKNLPINGEYERFSFDKLEKEEKYTFTYLVGSYNLGYTNATYEEDKILLEKTIETKVGIYGSIQLDSLLKQITSENLFDINNNKRWKKEGNSTIS